MNAGDKDSGLRFILIHGAGLGAWIWDDLIDMLDYPALAVNFPFRDGDPKLREGLTLSSYVDDALDQVVAGLPEKAVIVAHSIGGVVGLELAAGLGDKVVGFVGVGAAIPEPGGSFLSCLPLPKRLLMGAIMRLMGTAPPKSAIRQGLCNDLSEQQTSGVIERFIAESRALYTEGIESPLPTAARWYVKLGKDKEFGLPLQEKMITNLAAEKVVTIESGHLPMLSQPTALAAHLNDFASNL